MAAIYDPQGNIIGDDGGPTLDQMNLELSKQNRLTPQQMEKFVAPQSLASQIPGYGKPVPPSQTPPDPLGAAAGNFTALATKFNPLMMAKSMREAAGIITVPAVAAVKGVGESLTTSPAGTFTSGKAPAYAEKVATQFMQQNAPQTPMAQEFTSAIAPYMADLPAYLGQLSTGRPAFTPNDLRVMGAEATRVGRQVKDIPTDFYNAQSGMQRLDPITGQPTYGAKLQGVADSIGDIMAQREMQGLPPIPGLPASMQPTNPKLYAMRPEGSRVTSATLPATAKADAATYAPAQEIINNVIDSTTMTPAQALDEIQNNILRKPEAASARRAFESFLKQKANEMYPDAPSEGAALSAYKARFGDREASAAHSLEMYDQFLQTPNGIQYRAALDLPSAEELPAMHEAAANWLNSQFTNYIIEKVGTPNEPAAKLASQGLTFYPPSEVFDSADMSGSKIGAKRTAAGMPAKTPTDEALAAADQKLADLVQQSGDAATRKREQETIAKQLGYGAIDPTTGVVVEGMNLGRYEPFAQASRESDKANVAYKKQQKVVDNLRLGVAYENATDKAINAPTAKDLKENIEYSEQQFYPALMQTPDTERAYVANPVQLRNLGFEDLAKSFYSDVMSRKIHLDKVPKMTVEKYIRDTAEGRIAAEKLAQAKEKQFKTAADTQFKLSADTHIPNDKIFGNVGALEITNRFTPEEVAKLVSEDTLALDVCIGEGGNVRGKPNPWHPGTGDRQYIPIYDIVTGQRNPDATSPRGSYINAVAQGSQMVSFRDTVTGEPVAIFDFNPSASGKFDINFASGRKNKEVKPAYVEGIKSYLNSREDSIRGVSHNLNDNLDIYDSKRMSNSALADVINMPVSEFKKYDVSNLPRFITRTDLRNYIEALQANEPQVPVPAVMSQRPSESLDAYVAGAVSSSIDNVLDTVRRDLEEAGEDHQTSTAVAFFEDTRDYFNAYQTAQGPVRALELTRQRLYDLESEYANSPRIVSNIIAEGIADLMDDISGYTDYARNRQAAEAAQPRPRAIAMQGDPIPDMDTTELLLDYRDRLSPAQVQWLENFDDRWNGQEGNTDAGQQGLVDEYERWRNANRLAPEQAPDYLRMTHDAALQLDRQMGVDAGDELRSVFRVITEGSGLDPARDTDAFITALRGAAEVAARGSVETALNELADDMYTAYIRDWEPEVGPAAPPPAAREPMMTTAIADIIDTISNAVGENTTPGVGNRVGTIAYRIAQAVDARTDPVAYANALRGYGAANEHVAVASALRGIADLIEERTNDAEPARMAYREPSQPEAEAIMGGIDAEFTMQVEALRDNVTDGAVRSFSRTFGRLLSERGLDAVTMDSLPELGRMLDGLRTDIREQLEPLRREGFEGEAVAAALLDMSLAIRDNLANLEIAPARQIRGADLDNQRNDAMIQLENSLNDPELNPDDLRFLANGLSNPVDQTANSPWISLTDTERRDYAQALRERANYIEFSPADFAIRLSNEAGADIADLRDTVQALNDGTFDHEILRGLPEVERGRAAQRTALNLNHILQGMQADAQLRALNPNGVPPAPAPRAITRQQQAIIDRVPQITDMLIDFSVDDPIETAADYRRIANILRDPRNAREFLEDVMDVGSSLGDFVLRASDVRSSTLRLVADELESRAENWVAPADDANVARAADMRDTAEEIANLLEEGYYTETPNARAAVRLIRQHLRALRRNGEMAFEDILGMATTGYEWSPELLTALEVELESLIERYQGMDDYANGGPVRGYQAGGSVKKPEVKTPYLFSVPTYSETVAYEMYPGQKGQNDQRDAARHMLAAGTLSRKYGPKTAEFLGKAHEFTTSPLQSVKSMFTGKMPADYDMDTHNNTIGARLGQRAKSQAELEDLVQEEAERASRTQTQDKAFIKKANGGIVQQNPTTDQMRYALMMRRK